MLLLLHRWVECGMCCVSCELTPIVCSWKLSSFSLLLVAGLLGCCVPCACMRAVCESLLWDDELGVC